MKVLYITHTNIWGGANVALYNIINLMQQKGHFCYVLTNTDSGLFVEKLKDIHCDYFQYKLSLTIYPKLTGRLKRLRYIKRLFCSMFVFYKQERYAKQLILQLKPDIVHTNVGPFGIAIDTCIKMKIPHVWHLREYQQLDFGMCYFPTKKRFDRKIHSYGNYNIAITRGIFNYFRLRPGTDIVTYDGVFTQPYVDITPSKRKYRYFLFVGRIDEAKAPLECIRVFVKFHCQYPDYRLLLAGAYNQQSAYKKECDQLIEQFGLQNCIKFLGERRDVYQLMANAEALIVPSKFEGFGFITVEAMLNNCIVIGRDTGGTKEQFDIGERETGEPIGYRFTNDAELLRCLINIIEKDNSRMRTLAKQVVLNNYSIEKHVGCLESFYIRILNGYI